MQRQKQGRDRAVDEKQQLTIELLIKKKKKAFSTTLFLSLPNLWQNEKCIPIDEDDNVRKLSLFTRSQEDDNDSNGRAQGPSNKGISGL